jgi:putative DNA primase/helicase
MTFDIREHIEKLVPAKGKDRYICPVCEGDNLTINPKDGKYKCWSGCECKGIRNAISPAMPTAAPLEQPKPTRSKSDRTWTYTDRDGNPSIRTRRIDDGQGKRTIWQEYLVDRQWLSGGKVSDDIKTPPKQAIAPYKYVECQEAISRGETIFWAEGEPCADVLWELGLAATTSIGGSASYSKYGNYSDCFTAAKLVIVPDRDETGIKYAEAIASDYPAAQWLYAFPDSPLWDRLPKDGGLDISDWISELWKEGLSDEQIRDRVLGAIEPNKRPKASVAESPQSQKSTEPGFEGGKPHFWSTPEQGLVWESWTKDEVTGEFKKSLERIGNHLAAIAYVDNPDQNNAALYLEFKTIRNQTRRWVLRRNGLAGDCTGLINELLARGYGFKPGATKKLAAYLLGLGANIEKTYTITDRTGWSHDGSFVIENRTYGSDTLRFRDIEPIANSPFETKGTLFDWKSKVATLATGNSRLIFALGCAFAAPLAPILEVEGGGFHLFGATSTGKTSTLKMAASVMGIPTKVIQRWRATANGLEGLAVGHNHLLLELDEIGQADPRDVGHAAYMLANGQGKTRAARNGDRISPKTWNLQFLSTGEMTLTSYLKQANIAIKGGQEIRMLDIPACPQTGHGVLESIGEFTTPVEFIRSLEQECDRNYGTALDAFLKQLTTDAQLPEWVKATKDRLWAIARALSEVAPTDEVIGRVSLRFALVQTALEVAHSYRLLPFSIEQIGWAIGTMRDDWLNARGGVGSLEIKQALERIEHLFVSNEHSDRLYRVDGSEGQTVKNLLCYHKKDDFGSNSEYWVPPAIFDRELAIGVDRAVLITELQAVGWLKEPDVEGKNSLRRYLNGKRQRFYVFTQFWSDEKSGVPGVPGVLSSQDAQPEPISGGTPQDTMRDTVKNKVSHDCTEFDTTRDTLKNEVSHENDLGVPKETPTEQEIQADGTHRTHGTPKKQQALKTSASDFKPGDRIKYIGQRFASAYSDRLMTILRFERDRIICELEDTRDLTPALEVSDLQFVEEVAHE